MHHFVIAVEFIFVYAQHLIVSFFPLALVENAEHFVKSVIHASPQSRNLHDDAVVNQTVDESIGNTLYDGPSIVVQGLVFDVDHGFLDVPHLVSEQIYGNHGYAISFVFAILEDVFRIGILCSEVLAEA